jgi:hydroxymethylbilane synthase
MTSSPSRVTIATRGSDLALWQSRWVRERLLEAHPGIDVELRIIKTSGDRFQGASLQALGGGKGAFTKEIQDALLDGSADLAVHSLKDLPTEPVPGLIVWAHPARFDPRDAWIGRDGLRYLDLPRDAVVATGSLRRKSQVLHRYPVARVEEIRGNVDTRLRKFGEGSMAGMFLAMAGLVRLGLAAHVTEALEPDVFLPAPGQGALAIEGRNDARAGALLAVLDHAETRARVTAERSFLAELEGGCQVPVAALAHLDGGDVVLDGLVASVDGSRLVRDTHRGPRDDADLIGRELAQRLIGRGAADILSEIRAVGEAES